MNSEVKKSTFIKHKQNNVLHLEKDNCCVQKTVVTKAFTLNYSFGMGSNPLYAFYLNTVELSELEIRK